MVDHYSWANRYPDEVKLEQAQLYFKEMDEHLGYHLALALQNCLQLYALQSDAL